MRPADKHLTPQELDLLLLNPADSRDSNAPGALPPEAQQHLYGCVYCQSVADKCRNAEEALRNLRTWGRTSGGGKALAPGPECPREDTWSTLAAGLMSDEEAGPFITHAATCGCCGPRLKEAMHDLAQDITAEEQEALAKLPSASPSWQRAMARDLAAQQQKQKDPQPDLKPPFRWWPKLAWATALPAVAIIAVGVGWLVWLKTHEPDVNALLAQAYTEQRTIELRMPGAKYGPMRVQRDADKRIDLPTPFYIAQGVIKTHLAKHPEDPAWIQAQARAHILESNYKDAIEELDDALLLKPNDRSLLLDKATALFERAEKESPLGYSEALETLSLVIKQNPNDVVALFNRAIVYERISAPDDAVADLSRFLSVEPSGPWADEARQRLERLQKQIQTHGQAESEPLYEINEISKLAGDPEVLKHVDVRIEDYQERAIVDWLPTLFSAGSPLQDGSRALAGLRVLADLMAERHQDKWLGDLLDSQNQAPAFRSAITALGEAVRNSDEGAAAKALAAARRASDLFQKAGNDPGILRAKVEEVHALRRSQQGEECLTKAKAASEMLSHTAYSWLKAQVEIDQCSCSIMLAQFPDARQFGDEAQREADAARYTALQLRGIGIASAVETDEGNFPAAWLLNQKGLEIYWKDLYVPPIRAHQFYTDLSAAAEDLKLWNVALAMAMEGERAISATKDKTSIALTHVLVGQTAFHAGELDHAASELELGERLLAQLPEIDPVSAADAEVDFAGVELERGKDAQAEMKLETVWQKLEEIKRRQIPGETQGRQTLGDIQSYTVLLRYEATHGRLLERENKLLAAEAALLTARDVADSSYPKIKKPSERYIWSRETSDLYRHLVQVEFKLGKGNEAWRQWERYHGAASGPTGDRTATVPAGETFVSYVVLPEGLAIWIADGAAIDGYFHPLDTAELADTARYFERLCADPHSDQQQLYRSGAVLYRSLLAPVSARFNTERTVVIESDEILGPIPFEALVTPEGRYVGSLYRIVLSPGVIYEQHLRRAPRITATSRALVVASAAGQNPDSLSIVEQVQAEAISVTNRFQVAVLLQNQNASVSRIESELPSAEIFHYAGHAISNGSDEGLLLAGQSGRPTIWGADRIREEMFRHVNLAVLAACSTGRADGNRLQSHGDLVRAILHAGVPHVVASRWDVDSATTMQFMQQFYDGILSGKTIAVSINDAESWLQSRPETKHPYYWAAFAAFGRNN